MDATYQADLDRLHEFNFQRFDAKVEQRFAEPDAKLEAECRKRAWLWRYVAGAVSSSQRHVRGRATAETLEGNPCLR